MNLSKGDLVLDLLLSGLLLAMTAVMLLPGALGLPMELWDESRVANNAIEMAKHGGWLITTFDGVPDHWQLKPPILVWAMAALLRTGMDPMLAIRLPSIVATMASVLLVYGSCRLLLKDRLAGLVGGLLLVCSVLFMGDHVGRTGDYDALLCLLTLGFVICAGSYIDRRTISGAPGGGRPWIVAAALLLVLAILTKSVAGGFAAPGVVAYAMVRRRFFAVLADWWAWLSIAGVAAVMVGWFLLREWLHQGYLAAIWNYNNPKRAPARAWLLRVGSPSRVRTRRAALSDALSNALGPGSEAEPPLPTDGAGGLVVCGNHQFRQHQVLLVSGPRLALGRGGPRNLNFDLAAWRRFTAEVHCASACDGQPGNRSRAVGVFLVLECASAN